MQDFNKKTILVAPLDWGLGHATRCIPLIQELLHLQCRVLIAATGAQKALLLKEFPIVTFLDIPAYNIRYAPGRMQFLVKMVFQTPRILHTIKKEHDWLKQAIKQYRIDAVISDNRYGLHHPDVPTVFITHQLQVQSGFGNTGASVLRSWQYKYINRFGNCWVPDIETEAGSLAGALSHPKEMPNIPITYIGPLSRFGYYDAGKRYHLLVLLSGPEPQRSILEGKLLRQLDHVNKPVLFVRGLPGGADSMAGDMLERHMLEHSNKNLVFVNHLPAAELNRAVLASEYVICRSGYTTVMDLLKLQKKTIMVPTPAQTEQEYLAKHLHSQQLTLAFNQKELALQEALTMAEQFDYRFFPSTAYTDYKKVVGNFLQAR